MKISKYFNAEDFKLCYVDGHKVYFTTKDVTEQWGDDWDDAPYEHNAGTPYEPGYYHYTTGSVKDARDWNEDGTPKFEVLGFMISSDLIEPKENHCNSPYSVQDINRGEIAWLRSPSWVAEENRINIMAGTTFPEFLELISKSGGDVYGKFAVDINTIRE